MTQHSNNLARLVPERSALLIVDLQYRLVPVMHDRRKLVRRASRLVQGASILGVPQLATEQYPRGLGETVEEVSRYWQPIGVEEKTHFSAFIPPIVDKLRELDVDSVVVTGIEAHICVLRTCLDLLEAGYRVYPVWDAISSRRLEDQEVARERLIQAGAIPATVESVLFEWLGDAGDSRFRKLSELIKGDRVD